MKNTMSQYDFVNWFANSETIKDQFSREALFALFDYLEQYEDDCETEIEFDPVALCCEYTEHKTAWEAMEQYQSDDMPTVDDSEGMDLVELQEEEEALAL